MKAYVKWAFKILKDLRFGALSREWKLSKWREFFVPIKWFKELIFVSLLKCNQLPEFFSSSEPAIMLKEVTKFVASQFSHFALPFKSLGISCGDCKAWLVWSVKGFSYCSCVSFISQFTCIISCFSYDMYSKCLSQLLWRWGSYFNRETQVIELKVRVS